MAVGGVSAFKTVLDREAADARGEGNSVVALYAGDTFLPERAPHVQPAAEPADHAGVRRGRPTPDPVRRPHRGQPRVRHRAGVPRPVHQRPPDQRRAEPAVPHGQRRLHARTHVRRSDRRRRPDRRQRDRRQGRGASKIVVDDATGARYGVVGATPPETPQHLVARAGHHHQHRHPVDRRTRAGRGRPAPEASGSTKIILASQLQGINNDRALIAAANGIDLAVAGGGDELSARTPRSLTPPGAAARRTEAVCGHVPAHQVDTAAAPCPSSQRAASTATSVGSTSTFDEPVKCRRSTLPTATSASRNPEDRAVGRRRASPTASLPDPGIESTVIAPRQRVPRSIEQPDPADGGRARHRPRVVKR